MEIQVDCYKTWMLEKRSEDTKPNKSRICSNLEGEYNMRKYGKEI